MTKALRGLVMATGVACAAIGLFHFFLGIASVPGEGSAGATVDSRERFYNAIFLGYGVAWVWVARQSPIPVRLVRALAGVFLFGGLGRVLSLLIWGPPHWFQGALTVVELLLPALVFLLARNDQPTAEAATAARPSRGEPQRAPGPEAG